MSKSGSSEQPGATSPTRMHIHLKTVLRGHTQEVNDVRFSPDGALLASLAGDGIRLWDVGKYAPLCTLQVLAPLSIAFSPDGRLLAGTVGEGRGIVRLWTRNGEAVADLPGHEPNATEAVFSPDGSLLVSGDVSGQVRLWQVATRRLLCSFQAAPHGTVEPPLRPVLGVDYFTFTPDGMRLAMVSQDRRGKVQVWRIEHGGTSVEWVGSVVEPGQTLFMLAFSPDGRFLAAADFGKDVVWLFDASSLAPAGMLSIPDKDTPQSISFSPDGRFLATAGGAGTVWIWDMISQHIVTSFGAHTEGCDYRKESELWALGGIDWARTGGLIATSGTSPATFYDTKRQRYLGPDDYTVKLWDVRVEE